MSNITLPTDLDPEVIRLVEAINKFDGLETVNSCSGHNKDTLCVWLIIPDNDNRWLYPLGRATDRRYNGDGFTLKVSCNDMRNPRGPVAYLLESHAIGDEAYHQANALADRLIDIYNDPRLYKWAWEHV
jgi:hypothetical protein